MVTTSAVITNTAMVRVITHHSDSVDLTINVSTYMGCPQRSAKIWKQYFYGALHHVDTCSENIQTKDRSNHIKVFFSLFDTSLNLFNLLYLKSSVSHFPLSSVFTFGHSSHWLSPLPLHSTLSLIFIHTTHSTLNQQLTPHSISCRRCKLKAVVAFQLAARWQFHYLTNWDPQK